MVSKFINAFNAHVCNLIWNFILLLIGVLVLFSLWDIKTELKIINQTMQGTRVEGSNRLLPETTSKLKEEEQVVLRSFEEEKLTAEVENRAVLAHEKKVLREHSRLERDAIYLEKMQSAVKLHEHYLEMGSFDDFEEK